MRLLLSNRLYVGISTRLRIVLFYGISFFHQAELTQNESRAPPRDAGSHRIEPSLKDRRRVPTIQLHHYRKLKHKMNLLANSNSSNNNNNNNNSSNDAGRQTPTLGDATSRRTTNNDPVEEQRRRRLEELERRRWKEREASLETERILYQLKAIKDRLEGSNLRALHEGLWPATGNYESNLQGHGVKVDT